MIKNFFEQYEVIEETTAADFKDALNRVMREHKHQKPESKIEIAGPTWRAVVTYTEEVLETESLADEFVIRGEGKTCGDCPYFHIEPGHKGRRWAYCDEDGELKMRKKESPACEWLYEKIKRGEVKL